LKSIGDQLSLADLYLTPYLTRLVVMTGGDGTPDGILALSRYANLYLPSTAAKWEVGPKLKTWWATILEQHCFRKVYKNGIF
jgi:glutathione S-transferase